MLGLSLLDGDSDGLLEGLVDGLADADGDKLALGLSDGLALEPTCPKARNVTQQADVSVSSMTAVNPSPSMDLISINAWIASSATWA